MNNSLSLETNNQLTNLEFIDYSPNTTGNNQFISNSEIQKSKNKRKQRACTLKPKQSYTHKNVRISEDTYELCKNLCLKFSDRPIVRVHRLSEDVLKKYLTRPSANEAAGSSKTFEPSNQIESQFILPQKKSVPVDNVSNDNLIPSNFPNPNISSSEVNVEYDCSHQIHEDSETSRPKPNADEGFLGFDEDDHRCSRNHIGTKEILDKKLCSREYETMNKLLDHSLPKRRKYKTNNVSNPEHSEDNIKSQKHISVNECPSSSKGLLPKNKKSKKVLSEVKVSLNLCNAVKHEEINKDGHRTSNDTQKPDETVRSDVGERGLVDNTNSDIVSLVSRVFDEMKEIQQWKIREFNRVHKEIAFIEQQKLSLLQEALKKF